jgi:hypothetical protein
MVGGERNESSQLYINSTTHQIYNRDGDFPFYLCYLLCDHLSSAVLSLYLLTTIQRYYGNLSKQHGQSQPGPTTVRDIVVSK